MILVIEDHADTRNALTLLLSLEGYQAHGIGLGAEAIVYLAEVIPQLIILDYHLPDLSGLDVLIAIKADPRFAAVPVVMYTAYGDEEIRQRALAAGAVAFVVKTSLDWGKLYPMIAGLIGHGLLPASIPPPPLSSQKEIS